jgi:hypothetical protein
MSDGSFQGIDRLSLNAVHLRKIEKNRFVIPRVNPRASAG